MTKSLFLAVALFGATINASEHQHDNGHTCSCYVGGTPKAPTPSPKQEDREVKSAPSTPRPTK